MEWVTTTTILQRLRDFDDDDAWRRLVSRFRRPIVSFAESAGLSSADAEDAAQESLAAFADAFRSGRYDRTKGRLNKWLFGICVRHIRRSRQKESRHRRVIAGDLNGSLGRWPETSDATLSTVWDRHWERAVLGACLERARREFEDSTWRCFELTVQHDLSPAQAAHELGVPVKSVYNAKHRVLKRIRAMRDSFEKIE